MAPLFKMRSNDISLNSAQIVWVMTTIGLVIVGRQSQCRDGDEIPAAAIPRLHSFGMELHISQDECRQLL